MKYVDFIGNELALDDVVAVAPKNYRGLVKAVVIKMTPKNIKVEYTNTWNYGGNGRQETYIVPPCDVIKLKG